MGAKVVIQFVLLSLVSLMVEMTPISTNEDLKKPGIMPNDIESFFVSEKEESFKKNSLNNAVIEEVKARILNRLNLKERPKSPPPIPALQSFDQESNSWNNEANSSMNSNAKTEFLNSEIVPNTCFHETGRQCLRFHIQIPQHIINVNRSSAELWLYKKEGVTEYTLTHIIDDPLNKALQKELFSVVNQTKSAGWTRLDVTALMGQVRANVLDFEVSSNSVDVPLEFGNDKNPLLITEPSNSIQENSRQKRHVAIDCEGESSSCCRKSVYISFKIIGWDDWIVQPEGYNANACIGSCKNRLDLTIKHHAHVLLRLSKAGHNYSDIIDTVHCSPKSYNPLSIIYTDDKGLKVITNLPDMSVLDCACS